VFYEGNKEPKIKVKQKKCECISGFTENHWFEKNNKNGEKGTVEDTLGEKRVPRADGAP